MQTGLERENKNPAAVCNDRAGWSIFSTPGSVPAVVSERSDAISLGRRQRSYQEIASSFHSSQ
jgi:hypothetical protein